MMFYAPEEYLIIKKVSLRMIVFQILFIIVFPLFNQSEYLHYLGIYFMGSVLFYSFGNTLFWLLYHSPLEVLNQYLSPALAITASVLPIIALIIKLIFG